MVAGFPIPTVLDENQEMDFILSVLGARGSPKLEFDGGSIWALLCVEIVVPTRAHRVI